MKKQQQRFFPVRRLKASLIFSLILFSHLVLSQDADANLNESAVNTISNGVDDTKI